MISNVCLFYIHHLRFTCTRIVNFTILNLPTPIQFDLSTKFVMVTPKYIYMYVAVILGQLRWPYIYFGNTYGGEACFR